MEMRQPPSGAVIKNSTGGTWVPGEGMPMRVHEQAVTVSGNLAITDVIQTIGTTLGGTGLTQSLVNPRPGRLYRATLCVDVSNNNPDEGAQVVLFLYSSVDGQPQVLRAKNIHFVGAGTGDDGTIDNGRHCRLDLVAQLGEDFGVQEDSQVIQVIPKIALVGNVSGVEIDSRASSGPYSGAQGTAWLQLSELF